MNDQQIDFTTPGEEFRSNNYLQISLQYGKFSGGVQYEAYEPEPLLGYNPDWQGNGFSTFYLQFDHREFQGTVGYFYEQFGSGLILRLWEDRQLGINNALRGVRVRQGFKKWLDLTALYGEQKLNFSLSEAAILGLDTSLSVDEIFQVDQFKLDIAGSLVMRYQDNVLEDLPAQTSAYSGRIDFSAGDIFANFEGVFIEPDVLVYNGVVTNNEKQFHGNAFLLNLGYVAERFGLNATIRRLENFSFYSDRFQEGNPYNNQLLNYVPALTQQHDYLLNNIYVYVPQNRLVLQSFLQQAGEIGIQEDIYYSFPKESFFGGEYGTYLEMNFSFWAGLEAEFNVENNDYSTTFLGFGETYFREINFKLQKRWTENFSGIYSFTDLVIDKGITVGSPLGASKIPASILVAENTYIFQNGMSTRMELQHLWTDKDRRNWAAGMIEYNFSPSLGFYAADSWNYEGEGKIHYYNFGVNYSRGRASLAINYGRQRGGLICVGGVCRFVPENTGLSMNLHLNF